MRALDWQTVLDASLAVSSSDDGATGGVAGIAAGFGPSVDDIVVFSSYATQSVQGKLIKKPLLIGENNHESGLFEVLLGVQNSSLPSSTWDFLATSLFTCALKTRALASLYNKVPTWRYRYFGNFPNLAISTKPDAGAWHGIEIPTIFGADLDIQNKVGRTPEQEAVAAYVRGMWMAFAKDPVNGLNNYEGGLPQYHPLKTSLLRPAYNNQPGANAVNPALYDIDCVIDEPLLGVLQLLGLI